MNCILRNLFVLTKYFLQNLLLVVGSDLTTKWSTDGG